MTRNACSNIQFLFIPLGWVQTKRDFICFEVVNVIEFKDVSKVYSTNGTKALSNVNIKIEDGEFVFIVGSSGAAKAPF